MCLCLTVCDLVRVPVSSSGVCLDVSILMCEASVVRFPWLVVCLVYSSVMLLLVGLLPADCFLLRVLSIICSKLVVVIALFAAARTQGARDAIGGFELGEKCLSVTETTQMVWSIECCGSVPPPSFRWPPVLYLCRGYIWVLESALCFADF